MIPYRGRKEKIEQAAGMSLQDFAWYLCDRLFEPKLEEELQCTGWYALKKMVSNGEDFKSIYFHKNLSDYLRRNWEVIRNFKIEL